MQQDGGKTKILQTPIAMASDGFLPFADSIESVIEIGVSAVIEPGGSIRDEDVITACNKSGISLVFTGKRHFRH
jgi:phosphoribosylaminoimidazolecarboxamide formyltransferase/IMP cyclohydrolase